MKLDRRLMIPPWQGWVVLMTLVALLTGIYFSPILFQTESIQSNPDEVCPSDCELVLGCEEEVKTEQKALQDASDCRKKMTARGYCEGLPPEVKIDLCPEGSDKGVQPGCVVFQQNLREAEKKLSHCRGMAKKGFGISEYETCLSNKAHCRSSIYADIQTFNARQERRVVLRKIALWLWTLLSLALSLWGFFRTNQKIPSALLGLVALISLVFLGGEILLHILFPHGFIAH